jgi:hypothetical protein
MNGCETLRELWKIAQVCDILHPGIVGVPSRLYGLVQCANYRNFMGAAALKCWEERGSGEMPPFLPRKEESHASASSHHQSKGKQPPVAR